MTFTLGSSTLGSADTLEGPVENETITVSAQGSLGLSGQVVFTETLVVSVQGSLGLSGQVAVTVETVAAFRSVSSVAVNSEGSLSLVIPETDEGDLLLLVCGGYNSTAQPTTPNGWDFLTSDADPNDDSEYSYYYTRVAESGDTGSTVVINDFSGDSNNIGFIVAYESAGIITSAGATLSADGTDITAPVLSGSGLVIEVYGYDSNGGTETWSGPPAGSTLRLNGGGTGYLAYMLVESRGQGGDTATNPLGGMTARSFLLEGPASSGGTVVNTSAQGSLGLSGWASTSAPLVVSGQGSLGLGGQATVAITIIVTGQGSLGLHGQLSIVSRTNYPTVGFIPG